MKKLVLAVMLMVVVSGYSWAAPPDWVWGAIQRGDMACGAIDTLINDAIREGDSESVDKLRAAKKNCNRRPIVDDFSRRR